MLCNQVGFENRSPTADDTIRIGMVDLNDNDRWIDLGETRAWNWQQGCMLQWLPGSRTEVIYNDRADGQFVSHILDVKSGKKRTLPGPVYMIGPDAKSAVEPDFSRLADTRPGYSYAGIPNPYEGRARARQDRRLAHEPGDRKTGTQGLACSRPIQTEAGCTR